MTRIVPISATRSFVVSTEKAGGTCRLTKPITAVHFDNDGHGRIVALPRGAELHVIGFSCVREGFEVMWEKQVYSVFKIDLLQASSGRIEGFERPSQQLALTQRSPG